MAITNNTSKYLSSSNKKIIFFLKIVVFKMWIPGEIDIFTYERILE